MTKNNHICILYATIVLLVSTIYTMYNYRNVKTIEVEVPAKQGTFTNSKIEEIAEESDVYKEQLRDSIVSIIREQSEDKKKEFVNLPVKKKDSVYAEDTKMRIYKNTFEDDIVKIDYTAVTSGKLEKLDIDYYVKPYTLEVKQPKDRMSFLAGGSLRTNTKLDKVDLNATLGIQNRKGNIIYASYGTDKSVQLGYLVKF